MEGAVAEVSRDSFAFLLLACLFQRHTSGSEKVLASIIWAVAALEKAGFRILRQGAHIVMTDGTRILTIPRHNPVNAYTMGGIVPHRHTSNSTQSGHHRYDGALADVVSDLAQLCKQCAATRRSQRTAAPLRRVAERRHGSHRGENRRPSWRTTTDAAAVRSRDEGDC